MKREAKLLREKASDSLVLSIERFNWPDDRGRVSGSLIHLDDGSEMLLKVGFWLSFTPSSLGRLALAQYLE